MNSAILVFLTVKDSDKHKIIFSHHREINSNYPNQVPYWYSVEALLNSQDKIFGWSCIGTGVQIESAWKAISLGSELEINKKKFIFEKLSIPDSHEDEKNENILDGFLDIFSKYKTTLSKVTETKWTNEISSHCHLLLDSTFCNHISGIKKSDHDYGVFIPQGFWGENELLSYFEKSVVEVSEKLVPYVNFRGTGDLEKKDLQGFTGVCQQFSADLDSIEIKFYDLEKRRCFHSETVKLNNGWANWTATFNNAPSKGVIEVVRGDEVIGANKYYLLLDIKLDMKVLGGGAVFKDAYGRNISIAKKIPDEKQLKTINWNADYKLRPQLLSDDLTRIFSQMGEKILIQDPYLIGDVSNSSEITPGSVSFLNSLAVTVLNYQLKSITFLIDPRKINSEKRDKLKKYLKQFFEKLTSNGLEKIVLASAEATFHDRYFISLSEQGGLYHVSKSVNGFLESDDFNISLKDDDQTKQLKAQILYRFNKAIKEDVVG